MSSQKIKDVDDGAIFDASVSPEQRYLIDSYYDLMVGAALRLQGTATEGRRLAVLSLAVVEVSNGEVATAGAPLTVAGRDIADVFEMLPLAVDAAFEAQQFDDAVNRAEANARKN